LIVLFDFPSYPPPEEKIIQIDAIRKGAFQQLLKKEGIVDYRNGGIMTGKDGTMVE
jgi:hypothetical protein